ncbi:MAG: response regulator [Planctomycetes bacterium]|nr:response regulator [Planctomycetota bacterium]
MTDRIPAESHDDRSTDRHLATRQDLQRAQAVGRLGNWRLDTRRNVLTWSAETYRIFGIPEGTPLTYERFLESVHPDDRTYVQAMWQACLRGEPYDIEHRILVDGAVRWVREKAYMEFDAGGAVQSGFGIVQDITDLKATEEALRRLSQFPEENPNPVMRLDPDGSLGYANAPARRWLAALGWSPGGPLPAAVRDVAADVHRHCGVVEAEITGADDLTLWVSAVQPPGEAYVNIYGRDVTKRKRAEQRLQQARDELEQRVADRTAELERRAGQLARLTSELTLTEQRERQRLAQVLHDHLQQLLAAGRFALDMLASRVGDEHAASVHQVHDLLDEAIEAARSLTAELSPPILYEADLPAALEWLGRFMRQRYRLAVEVEVAGDIPPLREDRKVLLFQAARELLFNVIKHAGVNEARVDLAADEEGRIRLTVSDRGAGFDTEAVDSSPKGGVSAGGFGLFSIRERLQMLGGCMEIAAVPGGGAAVTLLAPCETSEAPAARAIPAGEAHEIPPAPAGRITVLLADDHSVMREGLAQFLGMEDDIAVIGQAADGQEAVDLARRLHPDVVLMDFSMPRLDGVAATRLILADHPDIRIIGLSMYVEADRAGAMTDAGAVAYLTKSGSTDLLLDTIRRHGRRTV